MDRNGEMPYQAYLLRLWPVDRDGHVYWRASLRCVSSGQRHGFENLEALFAYLSEATRPPEERPAAT